MTERPVITDADLAEGGRALGTLLQVAPLSAGAGRLADATDYAERVRGVDGTKLLAGLHTAHRVIRDAIAIRAQRGAA